MKSLYGDHRFKDVKIKCTDGYLMAHKSVLAISEIEYFKTFYTTTIGTEKNVIDIDLNMDSVDWLLKFAYGAYEIFESKLDYKVMLDIYNIIDRFQCTLALDFFKRRMGDFNYLVIPDEYKLSVTEIYVKEGLIFNINLDGCDEKTLHKIVYIDKIPSSYINIHFHFNCKEKQTYIKQLIEVFSDAKCTFAIFNSLFTHEINIGLITLTSLFLKEIISPKTYAALSICSYLSYSLPIIKFTRCSDVNGPFKAEIQVRIAEIKYQNGEPKILMNDNVKLMLTQNIFSSIFAVDKDMNIVINDVDILKLNANKDTIDCKIIGIFGI